LHERFRERNYPPVRGGICQTIDEPFCIEQNPGRAPLDVNLDYDQITQMAGAGTEAVIFTELAEFTRVGGAHGIIKNRSEHRPFNIFLRDIDEPAGQKIINLISHRYITPSRQPDHPRRSYAYIKGRLQLFNNKPEIIITSAEQISDHPPEQP
jgi:micrococcal nuclease